MGFANIVVRDASAGESNPRPKSSNHLYIWNAWEDTNPGDSYGFTPLMLRGPENPRPAGHETAAGSLRPDRGKSSPGDYTDVGCAEIVLRSQGEPYFGGPVVGGVDWSIGDSVAAAGEEPKGIFRVWSIVSRDVAPDELPLTQAAVEQAASFDELRDHPQRNCQPEGMPLVMDSFYPIEFTDHGDTISLRLERTDTTRTIHIRDGASSENQAPNRLGYSVGHWEGHTLVVTTDNIDFPYFDDDGTPQTESLVIVERFTMDDNRTTLQSTATATDPATFTAAVTILTNWRWVPGETIKPWNCAVSE